MTTYRIKPEYLTQWGDCTEATRVTDDEIEELAATWEMPIDSLLWQVAEVVEDTATDWENAAEEHEAAGRTECAKVCRDETQKIKEAQ